MAAPSRVNVLSSIWRYSKSKSWHVLARKEKISSHNFMTNRCYANSNILTLHDRGLFNNIFPSESDQLPKLLTSEPQCIYCGFDPTADSLHIGNLLALISLLHCQRAGHKCIALIGGATALIGDPSGKSNEREQLSKEIVESNIKSIQENLERVFSNHERCIWNRDKKLSPIRIMSNMEWYKEKNLIDFLSTVGRYFRMGTMLSRHSVQTRLKTPEGMNLAEFLYQVFQAYDFYHLHKNHNCLIQIGGTDQLGNIMAGHELISRATGKQVYGLTVPIVTSTTGDKLGKTAGNAVWIDSDKTSPFQLFQYFIRLPDSHMQQYLKLFTFLPMKEIEDIMRKHKNKPENRTAQRKLAEQVIMLVHGESGLSKAIRFTNALYSGSPETLEQLTETELKELFHEAPSTLLTLEPGITVLDLGRRVNCLPSGDRAEQIIEDGGFYINYRKVTNPKQVLLQGEHILKNDLTLLRVGKKNYHIVQWVY
ncbi:tyrosine--tRNA ligase, mitochondrial-like [Glandiceps talaboti]